MNVNSFQILVHSSGLLHKLLQSNVFDQFLVTLNASIFVFCPFLKNTYGPIYEKNLNQTLIFEGKICTFQYAVLFMFSDASKPEKQSNAIYLIWAAQLVSLFVSKECTGETANTQRSYKGGFFSYETKVIKNRGKIRPW